MRIEAGKAVVREPARSAGRTPAVDNPPLAIRPDWYAAYTSADPYAAMVTLYELRQPGSFALSREIQIACVRFGVDLDSFGERGMLGSVNAPKYGTRQAALEMLKTRCSRFHDESIFAYARARGDDPDGLRYQDARSYIGDTNSYAHNARLKEVTEEFVKQGQGAVLLETLRLAGAPILNSLDVSLEELDMALDVAKLKLTSHPDMAQKDIRLQYNCLRFGRCQYRYDELPARVSDGERARILRAAEQLEVSMRSSDAVRTVFGF